jgi:hypothetical protein
MNTKDVTLRLINHKVVSVNLRSVVSDAVANTVVETVESLVSDGLGSEMRRVVDDSLEDALDDSDTPVVSFCEALNAKSGQRQLMVNIKVDGTVFSGLLQEELESDEEV